MDPSEPAEGQNEPSEQSFNISPSSSGRQRKKNPKYLDYEMNDAGVDKTIEQAPSKKSSEGDGASLQKGQRKGRKPRAAVQKPSDGKKASTDSVGETVAATPKKRGRPPKTPKPSETVTADGNLPAGKTEESVAEKSAQQENVTPNAKRKYVRKKAQQVVEDPPREKDPAEPEDQTGGRHRRGAAKAALKYLHTLAKEMISHASEEPGANRDDSVPEKKGPGHRNGRRRKRYDSAAPEDEDFVPNVEEEADEMESESEEEYVASDSDVFVPLNTSRQQACSVGQPANVVYFKAVWEAAETTKKFREEHYSSWVFPEWVPSIKDWDFVAESSREKYLPEELESVEFSVTREGLQKEEKLRLSRFESVPAHSDRWDMLLFAGGPVWALEWCPTPDGAPATQYVALACYRGMDDVHRVNQTYTEPGLVQLWDCGRLKYNNRPDSQPVLVYGLAQDKGFIWQLKWCPAGGWEPPSSSRKAPFLPRLGLLAVATSNGVVTIYSLPHPDALLSNQKCPTPKKDDANPPIYKVRGVMTLKLGSIKAPRREKSGQVLSMDWLPQKPHNIMAVGFYDGIVGLWDLSTKSALLRVRESDRSLTLLPYRCILAHDQAVRALTFCAASRHLLATAGEDRYVKTWDLRRLFEPIKVQRRYLSNEMCWPLDMPGVMKAKDLAFVPHGSMGVHFLDHNLNTYFAISRSIAVWSLSYSEWVNGVLSADALGEVIFTFLPVVQYAAPHIKRTILKRFPAYFTSKMLRDEAENDHEGPEKEEHVAQEGGDAASEGGGVRNDASRPLMGPTYRDAAKRHLVQFSDFDMTNLERIEKRALWKRMQSTEGKLKMDLDEMPLTALHKVRFSPNMSSHLWLASGGQTGLVRLHCLRSLVTSQCKKMIAGTQTQFNALYSQKDQREEQL
ncbi:general transcription factor 3C polypeptide 2 isoform X1 [Nothobranchius furzeri]|uniref:General transcription factor 3C polypeptide 2 n=3 Tax=Nothobranchius TaxID=28779 RepID=A0A1A8USZ0_NOTFU|nr:general transcription factor IIIC subunit 2 [Nothobranchius furzeri]